MQTKKLIPLLIVGIIMCVVTFQVYQKQQNPTKRNESKGGKASLGRGDQLVAGLDEQTIDKIAHVEIDKDGEKIVFKRDDEKKWTVESVGGYPADPSKINELVFNLMDCVVTDRLTDKEDKYANFGLEGEKGTAGMILLADKDGKEIARLLRGDDQRTNDSPQPGMPPQGGGGRYFRLGGDPHVYLAQDANPYISTGVSSWVETEITSVPSEKIVGLAIDHATTEPLKISWKSGSAELDGLDEDMQLKTYEVNSLQGALDNLSLSDVLSAGSEKAAALSFATTFTATSKHGAVYTAQIAEADAKHYLKLSAVYGEPFLTAEDKATTVSQAEAEKEAKIEDALLPDFNEKHAPWIYELSSWKAGNFTKKRSGIIEPAPEPEPEPEPVPEPADAPTTVTLGESVIAPMPPADDSKSKLEPETKSDGEPDSEKKKTDK